MEAIVRMDPRLRCFGYRPEDVLRLISRASLPITTRPTLLRTRILHPGGAHPSEVGMGTSSSVPCIKVGFISRPVAAKIGPCMSDLRTYPVRVEQGSFLSAIEKPLFLSIFHK